MFHKDLYTLPQFSPFLYLVTALYSKRHNEEVLKKKSNASLFIHLAPLESSLSFQSTFILITSITTSMKILSHFQVHYSSSLTLAIYKNHIRSFKRTPRPYFCRFWFSRNRVEQSIGLVYKTPQVQIRLRTSRTRGRIFHLSFESLAWSLHEFLSYTSLVPIISGVWSHEDMRSFLGNVISHRVCNCITDSFLKQHTIFPSLVPL